MVYFASPDAWAVIITGDQAAGVVGRAAGPFRSQQAADNFAEHVLRSFARDDTEVGVVRLEDPNQREAFVIGYR